MYQCIEIHKNKKCYLLTRHKIYVLDLRSYIVSVVTLTYPDKFGINNKCRNLRLDYLFKYFLKRDTRT